MGLLRSKTDEEKAQAQLLKQEQAEQAEARRAADEREKAREAFLRSPAGQARTAYERSDQVFQYSHDVMSQEAFTIPMVGAYKSQKTKDPSAILNSVCNEGWELVAGSFVFVQRGQESRDKFMASGQQVSIDGTTVGYYLFKRCDANKRETNAPWEGAP